MSDRVSALAPNPKVEAARNNAAAVKMAVRALLDVADGGAKNIEVVVLTASATRAIVRGPLAPGERVSLDPQRVMWEEE